MGIIKGDNTRSLDSNSYRDSGKENGSYHLGFKV